MNIFSSRFLSDTEMPDRIAMLEKEVSRNFQLCRLSWWQEKDIVQERNYKIGIPRWTNVYSNKLRIEQTDLKECSPTPTDHPPADQTTSACTLLRKLSEQEDEAEDPGGSNV